MLKIRLQRIGRRNDPSYRIVAVDSRVAANKGKPVALLGTYDTVRKKTTVNKDLVLHWISKGAQVSDTVHNILVTQKVLSEKKRNVLPKKRPLQKEQDSKEEKSVVSAQKEEGSKEEPEETTTGAEEESKEVETTEPTATPEESLVPEPTPTPEAEPTTEKATTQPTQSNPSSEG